MAYEKLLNEIYAALSLKYLWKDYKPSFVKSESPDWINATMNLGMEVSQALLPDDGQMESFIEKYLGMPKEQIPPSAKERYGDRLHFYNGRFWAILPDENLPDECIKKAKYRFDKKLEKLNSNYRAQKYNSLYLFLHPTEAGNVDVATLFEYMKNKQSVMQEKFHWVFLNCTKVIYVCNFMEDTMEEIVLPQNAETFLNTEAEYLRYSGEWNDGVSLDT